MTAVAPARGAIALCPVAVLRSAGLPFAWLDEVADADAAAAVDAADDARAERVARASVERADAALRAVAARPGFEAAVAAANPDLHATTWTAFVAGDRRARRQRRRTIAALLQRYAAKNDTAAGFGPMDRARAGGAAALVQPDADAVARAERRGLLGWWVVQEIADAVARDDACARSLPARVHSLARVDGDVLSLGDRAARLAPHERALLDALARGEPVGGDSPRLRRAGVVRRDLLVPPAQFDPAAWLARRLDGVTGARRWRDALDDLRRRADDYARSAPGERRARLAALERDVERLLGRPLERRGTGAFYADRRVVYEDARGAPGDYAIGGPLLEGLAAALSAVCRLAAAYGHARHLDAAAWLHDRVGGRAAPLPEVAEAARALPAGRGPRAAALAARVEALARGGADAGELDDALAAEPAPRLSLASPDVMLDCAPDGSDARLVCAELHPHLQVLGILQMFWRDDDASRWAADALGDDLERVAQVVTARSQGKAYPPELPAWSIEFEAAALSPRRARFAEVVVEWRDRSPLLRLPDGTRAEMLPVDVTNPFYAALSPHAALLPRLGRGAHTPEAVVGGMVVQRATWRPEVPGGVPNDPAGRFLAARRWRALHGLPERAFVRAPGQPKPFYVDFRNPLAADVLWHWTRAGDELAVTPMDPGPRGLWLRRGGDAFTSEIRMSAVVRGGA